MVVRGITPDSSTSATGEDESFQRKVDGGGKLYRIFAGSVMLARQGM
jgi:hypothetical protein